MDYFLYRWPVGGYLRIEGEDAFSYLQSQLSCDLRPVRDRESIYGLLLDRKGGIQADIVLQREAEDCWKAWSPGFALQRLLSLLEGNIIADEVAVDPVYTVPAPWLLLPALEGAPKEDWLPTGDDSAVHSLNQVSIQRGYLGPSPHWFLFTDNAEAVLRQAGIEAGVVDHEEFLRYKLRRGWFVPGLDGGEGELPQELGLDRVAVSFTKGCYLGQEVMARLKAMGKVQWALVRGQLSSPLERGAQLTDSTGKPSGIVRVVGGNEAICRVRRSQALPGTQLHCAAPDRVTFTVTGGAGWHV